MRIGFLGVGTNMGDRAALLTGAVDELRLAGIAVEALSPVYETAPQGDLLDQPDFLNAVVKVRTDLSPEDLLSICKQIEVNFGRTPGPRHAPRPLDIDLLLLGDLSFESDLLTLPHRDLANRRFVLEPLKDLAPDLMLPEASIDDRLAALQGQPVKRVAIPGWPWDAADQVAESAGFTATSTLTIPLAVTVFSLALAVAVNELWNPLAAGLLAAPVLSAMAASKTDAPRSRVVAYAVLTLLAVTAWMAIAVLILSLIPELELS